MTPTAYRLTTVVYGILCFPPFVLAAEPKPVLAGLAGTSFVDTFTRVLPQRWLASHGWSNGDHQGCVWSRRNVRVLESGLSLIIDEATPAETKDVYRRYACAELQSHGRYGFGTYEVRMRAAAGAGLVTAFFTFTGPPHGADRPHDEIDVEHLGKSPRLVQLNHFASGKTGVGSPSGERRLVVMPWLADSAR
jgi:endo-1,3-1,4-beta-glycanase ExoK